MVISSKERNATEVISQLGDKALMQDIPVGDVIFRKGDKVYVQAEIKQYQDLLASVVDGRYHQQAAAMQESGVPFSFFLVFGVKPPSHVTDSEQKRAEHAMTRVQLASSTTSRHIAVLYLTSTNALVSWIEYVCRVLQESISEKDTLIAPLCTRIAHRYTSKSSSRGTTTVYKQMLSCVRGMGQKTVERVEQKFPTIPQLVDFLSSSSDATSLADVLKNECGVNQATFIELYQSLLGKPAPEVEPARKRRKIEKE